MTGTHAYLPPSSAAIWGAPFGCSMWPVMNQTYPEAEQSPEAAEGDAAHELGASFIEARNALQRDWVVGSAASNGILFDDEMYESAVLYCDDVMQVLAALPDDAVLAVEAHVKAHSTIHLANEGTTDVYIYSKKANVLYVWDFKYGHSLVEAFENWQGIDYAAGIYETLWIKGDPQVIIRIVQPRGFHREGPIRGWETTLKSLKTQFFPALKQRADSCFRIGMPEAHSGAHCRYCPGRHSCEAALQAGIQMYEASTYSAPVELSADALGVQLTLVVRARKQLEYLETGYREQANALIRDTVIPGWMMESRAGREIWDKEDEEVVSMGDMMEVDLRKPVKACTPKQAREKGVSDAMVSQYSKRASSGLVLTPNDGTKARKVFAK